MSKEDYYRMLGVERDASKDDLKKAYRKLALRIIRIAIPATRMPNAASRRSTRPTRSSGTTRSGPPTIVSVMRRSSTAGPAATAASGRLRHRLRRHLRGDVRRLHGAAGAAAVARPGAAPTCATTSKSTSKMRSPARRRRCGCPRPCAATSARAAVRLAAGRRRPARPVAVPAGCGRSRASSPSSGPVRAAAAPARPSATPAGRAAAPAGCSARRRCR